MKLNRAYFRNTFKLSVRAKSRTRHLANHHISTLLDVTRIIKITLCLLSFIVSVGYSQNSNELFNNANQQYAKGDYEKAIELYQNILNTNVESSELYFNLGNAYYKTNKIGLAILNYEKAKKLSPADEDIETNLTLANLKTEDKIDALPRLFIYDWIDSITNAASEKGWSLLCIGALAVSLIWFVFYLLSTSTNFKKIFFYSGFMFILITICFYFFAQHKYHQTVSSGYAIITSATTTINSSPALKSTKLFILHEGTKVAITGEENNWVEIKLTNGNVGWVDKKDVERI